MFSIIEEKDRKYRTWEEICTDFPNAYIALADPDSREVACTGGTVVAYAIAGNAIEESNVGIYAVEHKCTFTDTLEESRAYILW